MCLILDKLSLVEHGRQFFPPPELGQPALRGFEGRTGGQGVGLSEHHLLDPGLVQVLATDPFQESLLHLLVSHLSTAATSGFGGGRDGTGLVGGMDDERGGTSRDLQVVVVIGRVRLGTEVGGVRVESISF